MEKIYEEVLLKDSQPPKLLEETELKYMKSKICKITVEKKIGTGFFCKITYNNKLFKNFVSYFPSYYKILK